MAKDNLKLQVAIDGDNKGFMDSLKQTKQSMAEFAQSAGGVGMGIGNMAAASFVGSALARPRNIAQNISNAIHNHSAARMRALTTKRNNLDRASGISGRHGSAMSHVFGDMADYGNRSIRAEHKAAKRRQMFGNLAGEGVLMGAAALKGGAVTAAIAAAAAAAVWKMGTFGRQQLENAGKFSATVTAAQAMKEQRDIMRQVDIANNPFLMGQQERLIASKERREQAGAVGFGVITTEASIAFNDFIAALKEFSAGVIGADDITSKGVVY